MSLLQCEWNYVGAQTVSRLSALHYNLLRSIPTYQYLRMVGWELKFFCQDDPSTLR